MSVLRGDSVCGTMYVPHISVVEMTRQTRSESKLQFIEPILLETACGERESE